MERDDPDPARLQALQRESPNWFNWFGSMGAFKSQFAEASRPASSARAGAVVLARGGRGRQARHRHHAEPGQPADGRRDEGALRPLGLGLGVWEHAYCLFHQAGWGVSLPKSHWLELANINSQRPLGSSCPASRHTPPGRTNLFVTPRHAESTVFRSSAKT